MPKSNRIIQRLGTPVTFALDRTNWGITGGINKHWRTTANITAQNKGIIKTALRVAWVRTTQTPATANKSNTPHQSSYTHRDGDKTV